MYFNEYLFGAKSKKDYYLYMVKKYYKKSCEKGNRASYEKFKNIN
jgi:hypothetical protein